MKKVISVLLISAMLVSCGKILPEKRNVPNRIDVKSKPIPTETSTQISDA